MAGTGPDCCTAGGLKSGHRRIPPVAASGSAALGAGQREADTLRRRGDLTDPTSNRRAIGAPGGAMKSDARAKIMA